MRFLIEENIGGALVDVDVEVKLGCESWEFVSGSFEAKGALYFVDPEELAKKSEFDEFDEVAEAIIESVEEGYARLSGEGYRTIGARLLHILGVEDEDH